MSNDDRDAEIRVDRIPVRGGFVAAVVILVLLAAMFLDLPGLQFPMVAGIAGGVVLGVGLIAWHRRTRK